MALIVIGGGLVAAMLVSAVRYLEDRNKADTPQPAAQNSPPVEEPAPAKKPSAMPDLPGDRGANPSDQPETREQSDADQASPAPAAPKPPSASHPEQSRTGHGTPVDTRLVTNPPGARLTIDGSPALSCQAPCSLTLPSGRHTLAATMPGFRRTLRILETPRDNEVFLNLDRSSGTVMIRSEPRGATIYVNGEARSDRTPAMFSLPVGNYTIEVVNDGQRESRQVQVRDSEITNVAVEFGR